MNAGIFFLVVGPSGAGKDALIDGARGRLAAAGRHVFAKRTITRAEASPGEDHEGVPEAEFDRRERAGEFLSSWRAHGCSYGLAASLLGELESGRHVVANGSRSVVRALAERLPNLVVIEVSAPPEVLAARIVGRGRESADEVRLRLARRADPIPDGIRVRKLQNDGTLAEGVARFVEAIESVSDVPAAGSLRVVPEPASREWLVRKIRGGELDETQYRQVLRDVTEGRYAERDLTAFLVAATRHLSDAEVLALARARASLVPPITWDAPMVVDKHSLGGVPGNRLSLIVVPLVAAHGLLMPKTSSRAITSAAGTADVMEVAARVDLDAEDVRRCVSQANACIAWNGRLNHSAFDTAMNAITRPLALDANRWSVASILSKKKAAGATHVIVDLPWGPRTKLHTEPAALELAALFEATGRGLGLHVRALATDGGRPIGRGIGPALEWRDVNRVLDNDADAPVDLREKALLFAGHILSWDPRVGSLDEGFRLARALLHAGEARRALDRIVDAQGRHREPARPSPFTRMVVAPDAGVVAQIDGWALSGIARQAGAPGDKGSGIDLLCRVGDMVRAGDPLYRIHAASREKLCTIAESASTGIELAPLRVPARAGSVHGKPETVFPAP